MKLEISKETLHESGNSTTNSISHQIISYFSEQIQNGKDYFHETQTFKLTAYGMEFSLDRVDGSYESSLPLLISKIMFHKGYYEDVLSSMLEDNAAMQSAALARGDRVTYLELSEESMGSDFLRAWDLWKRRVSMGGP
mgnify:CR=1 FL=1